MAEQQESTVTTTTSVHPLQSEWTIFFDTHKPKSAAYTYPDALQSIAKFKTVEDFMGYYRLLKLPSELGNNTSLHIFRSTFGEGDEKIELIPAWENMPEGGTWSIRFRRQVDIKKKPVAGTTTQQGSDAGANGVTKPESKRKNQQGTPNTTVPVTEHKADEETERKQEESPKEEETSPSSASVMPIDRKWESLVFSLVGEALLEPNVVGITCTCKPKEDLIIVWHATNLNEHEIERVEEKIRGALSLPLVAPVEYRLNSDALRTIKPAAAKKSKRSGNSRNNNSQQQQQQAVSPDETKEENPGCANESCAVSPDQQKVEEKVE